MVDKRKEICKACINKTLYEKALIRSRMYFKNVNIYEHWNSLDELYYKSGKIVSCPCRWNEKEITRVDGPIPKNCPYILEIMML